MESTKRKSVSELKRRYRQLRDEVALCKDEESLARLLEEIQSVRGWGLGLMMIL